VSRNKTVKVPFEVILRNKKTKKEYKVNDITIPIKVNVSKELLHKIMEDNVMKELEDDEDGNDNALG